MNNKQSILLAIVGAGFMAASPAHAQINVYNDNDLLLNFRESVDDSGSDMEVDLGNVSNFLSAVAALTNGTAVLDSGAGYNTSAYTPQFTGANLISVVGNSLGDSDGSADNIGFSAAAENLGAAGTAENTLWLTRVISASDVQTGGTPSTQGSSVFQNHTAADIQLIGYEAESSDNGGAGTGVSGAVNAGLVSDSDPYSYHTLGKSPASPDVIDYGGYVSGTSANPLEGTPSSGTIYEALWQAPVFGDGTVVYLGYFAFQTNGELDFTVASAAHAPPTNMVSLTITVNGPNSVQVLWPNTTTLTLQQNTNLAAPSSWTSTGYTISTSNGTNSITISLATGNLFFRLFNP
jgi:hypothetical protein